MEVDCDHPEPGAGVHLRIPAVMEFIRPRALRTTVDQERDRIFLAGFGAYRRHHVAVHRVAVPALEGEPVRLRKLDVGESRGVEMGDLRDMTTLRIQRIEIGRMAEVLARGNDRVAPNIEA